MLLNSVRDIATNEGMVLFLGLAISFIAVEYRPRIKLLNRKPFNCVKCMTGWCSVGIAFVFGYEWNALWFLPLGVFIGAMFEGIRMRYL